MASRGHMILFLATIFLHLFLHFPSQTNAANVQLLNKACTQIKNRKGCVRKLQSCPRISSAKDIKAVAEVALAAARVESAGVRDFFSAKYKRNPKKAFKFCLKSFNEAIKQLNLGGLEGGTASLDIHYAYDGVESCTTALSKEKIVDQEISKKVAGWKYTFSIASSAVTACEEEFDY